MPIVDFARYCAMLDSALEGRYAYPAVNVLQMDTLNAAIEGFAAARSDGIIQISVAAGVCASGKAADPVLGAISLAEHAHRIAAKHDVGIAVHSDHCPTQKVDSFLRPLIAETARRRARGEANLFQSHMYDGSALPLKENLRRSVELLQLCRENDLILEVEAGVVGGEEDGIRGAVQVPALTSGRPSVGAVARSGDRPQRERLYTTPEDMLDVYETLSAVEGARFLLAATFGNVHGVYKPGRVQLRPAILKAGQDAVMAKHGPRARMHLVFHGGSGTPEAEIRETIEYGVVKMNIHTDTQYAFTRAVADFMFKHYDGVLRIDGEVGVKQQYLASTWLEAGRDAMAARVVEACRILGSAGRSMGQ
ncbi:MAG TPA: class II fructose-bisphosphate aldolase [Candidatus Hydrogenedentes bacterium]|nr:class II fructose-bisphosphate aldolase [Candidatus Hydrogenedentota bacterium]